MKTTKKHFELFKTECAKWIEYFGLKDWEVSYQHAKIDMRGSCMIRLGGKVITLILSEKWETPKDVFCEKMIRQTAFHEVCEILLAKTGVYLNDFYADRITDEIIHEVIQRLSNSIFEEKTK